MSDIKTILQKYDFLVLIDKNVQENKKNLQKCIIIKQIFNAYWHIKNIFFRLH